TGKALALLREFFRIPATFRGERGDELLGLGLRQERCIGKPTPELRDRVSFAEAVPVVVEGLRAIRAEQRQQFLLLGVDRRRRAGRILEVASRRGDAASPARLLRQVSL